MPKPDNQRIATDYVRSLGVDVGLPSIFSDSCGSGINLREAAERDLDNIWSSSALVVDENGEPDAVYGTLSDDFSSRSAFVARFMNGTFLTEDVVRYVVEDMGVVLGRLDVAPSVERNGVVEEIQMSLWVRGDRRRQGIGSEVVRRATEEMFLDRNNLRGVRVNVDSQMGDYAGVKAFLEGTGFSHDGLSMEDEEVESFLLSSPVPLLDHISVEQPVDYPDI
jgi:GNAT superfamily N-acetyltransferase